jgi:hypothetical protein
MPEDRMSKPTFDDALAGKPTVAPAFTTDMTLPVKTVSTIMRGHTMGPIKDGWLIFFEHRQRPPRDEVIDELCVVLTESGRRLIRYVKRSPKADMYDLLTFTGQPEMDVKLQWAEPVIMIKPNKLNDVERAGMARLSETMSDF